MSHLWKWGGKADSNRAWKKCLKWHQPIWVSLRQTENREKQKGFPHNSCAARGKSVLQTPLKIVPTILVGTRQICQGLSASVSNLLCNDNFFRMQKESWKISCTTLTESLEPSHPLHLPCCLFTHHLCLNMTQKMLA